MNKKLYFNLIFLIAGSVIVLTMGSIVTLNFAKDSRLLGKPALVAEQTQGNKPTPAPKSTQTPNSSNKNSSTTIVYVRPVDPKPTAKPDPGEGPPMVKPVDLATPTPQPDKTEAIKVEVINCTGEKNVAEKVRATLEAGGYEVSAGNGPSNKPVKTEIIERNDKGAGSAVRNIIKVGKLSKSPDPNSKYDVTVILGDDFLP